MTLHRYFARRFLFTFLGMFAVFVLIMLLADLVEQLRRFGRLEAGFMDILTLTLLNVPRAVYRILPLIMILSAIALFLSLARSSELVVTRAAGRSALRSLLAPLAVALTIGVLAVAVMNPIVAGTSKQFEVRVDDLRGESSTLSIASSGFWLRQGNQDGQTVIRAQSTNLDGTRLTKVTFLSFDREGTPVRRIEAEKAQLQNNAWGLEQAKVWNLQSPNTPEATATREDTLSIPSSLTADQIRDSFGTPSSIPIWELPAFIDRLQAAGFSARRHLVWFHSELALPVFLVAMVMIGASFTLRHQRGGRTGLMVMFAITLAFLIYFVRNFAQVLGENGQLPALLAAWAPPFAAIGLALGFLLHSEDG
ncbi:LPS export ABC transporter permease LptG [Yoonia sediminilitoris]|uniref:Lipopolysaccharide export system permease protein n=1 Tax=Yoonia sediminilitoris TaxID=1286148 RepID=A0A2T6KCT8_9RHOB|nr:LPS export ABC transporter permease LptG [Yoonia sediminilitoris]PUB12757.1 lipopolysaccharide export system permease protein [Yoonia sediminilitoris]RCW94236.1 lipopolysaccharide export system permease protein [Yoonia sediminilitoris]